jgi:hypothetical protein
MSSIMTNNPALPWVSLNSHGSIAAAALPIAIGSSALFFLSEGSRGNVLISFLIAFLSSIAWGVAVVFLLLWTGLFL